MLLHCNSDNCEVKILKYLLACCLLLQCIFQEESKESSGISHKLIGNTESHLKYENDRLKMALAQR